VARNTSPCKPRHETAEPGTARGDQGLDLGRIGRAKGIELLGVDGTGDEQQVGAEGRGADGVGPDAVADGEDADGIDAAAGGRIGQLEGLVIARAIGLAGHQHLAAARRIDVGHGAGAVDQLLADLDELVGVGADQR